MQLRGQGILESAGIEVRDIDEQGHAHVPRAIEVVGAVRACRKPVELQGVAANAVDENRAGLQRDVTACAGAYTSDVAARASEVPGAVDDGGTPHRGRVMRGDDVL